MADLLVLLLMTVAAMAPFALCTFWMMRGLVGYPLTMVSVFGAGLAIAIFASSRPAGVDPVTAISAGLLVFLPGTLGSMAGALLGWMIYRRRQS